MNALRHSLIRPLGLALLSAALTAGCMNKSEVEQLPDFAKSSAASSIGGAGSTFIDPLMNSWISGYGKVNPGITVNYRPVGSGEGINEFGQRLTEMAASEAPLTDDQIAKMTPTVQIPVAVGPVCITYNLPGLKAPLHLSASTLANIFLGKIVTWQDSAVARDNPGVQLPQAPVIVTHRSDASGTTYIFSTFLSKVSPEWAKRVGEGLSVTWPTGFAGQGTKAMMDLVNQTTGTIAYAELTYAKQNNLPVASIENQAGAFVAPTPASAAAAVLAFSDDLAKDIRTPIVNPPASAKDAYPISGLSFLLLQKDLTDPDQQKALKEFITYAIGNGQDAAEGLYYAKLPPSLEQRDQALLAELTASGKTIN